MICRFSVDKINSEQASLGRGSQHRTASSRAQQSPQPALSSRRHALRVLMVCICFPTSTCASSNCLLRAAASFAGPFSGREEGRAELGGANAPGLQGSELLGVADLADAVASGEWVVP
jgi:hypothetical protein